MAERTPEIPLEYQNLYRCIRWSMWERYRRLLGLHARFEGGFTDFEVVPDVGDHKQLPPAHRALLDQLEEDLGLFDIPIDEVEVRLDDLGFKG